MDVRVDAKAVLLMGQGENEIGRLPPHPLQAQKILDSVRYLRVELPDEGAADLTDVAALAPVETHGVDGPGYRFLGKLQHFFRRGGQREEPLRCGGRDLVLRPGTQDRGDENFESVALPLCKGGCDRQIPLFQMRLQDADDFDNVAVVHNTGHGVKGVGLKAKVKRPRVESSGHKVKAPWPWLATQACGTHEGLGAMRLSGSPLRGPGYPDEVWRCLPGPSRAHLLAI